MGGRQRYFCGLLLWERMLNSAASIAFFVVSEKSRCMESMSFLSTVGVLFLVCFLGDFFSCTGTVGAIVSTKITSGDVGRIGSGNSGEAGAV